MKNQLFQFHVLQEITYPFITDSLFNFAVLLVTRFSCKSFKKQINYI